MAEKEVESDRASGLLEQTTVQSRTDTRSNEKLKAMSRLSRPSCGYECKFCTTRLSRPILKICCAAINHLRKISHASSNEIGT